MMAWAQKALVMGSFMGGALIFVLAAVPLLWRVSVAWRFGLIGFFAGLFIMFSSRAGGFEFSQAFLLSIFITGAIAFVVVTGRVLNPANKSHLFLMLWVLGGLLELIIVMPWTAGRYLLCVLPALSWTFVIVVEDLHWRRLLHGTLVVTALAGFLLAHADYVQANTIVRLSDVLRARAPELEKLAPHAHTHWYYLADTFDGSQPYLLPLGWQNVLPYQKFKPGDLFLRAYYRKSSWWNVDNEMKRFKPVARFEVTSWNPLRVMDVPASAGFYASCWGALPWMIMTHPLERFELYQAVSE